MANRRGAGGGPKTGAPPRPGTAGDEGRRPTKAERKEEARRQRLEIQRRAAKRRRTRIIAAGVVAALAAGAIAFALTRPKPKVFTPEELLAAAPAAAEAASCETVSDVGPFRPENLDAAHIGVQGGPPRMPPLTNYPSIPPASGPHGASPLPAGVYEEPPPLDQAIHSLEHGAAIVWYDPGVSGQALADIKRFFDDSEQRDHVIVAPYDYPDLGPAGTLPAGTQMALVAWHNTQACGKPSLAVAFDFVAHYRFPPFDGEPYQGDAPEQGAPI